jgi:hypothetical protein
MSEPLVWFKSSASSANGQCVECARLPGGIAVRDSVNRGGPMLRFTAAEWQAFVARVTTSEFK